MKNWLKENWFKLVLSVAIFIYLFLFIYEQRRETRIFNANLIKWCVTHNEIEDCEEFIKKGRLGAPWEFWDWLK